MRWFTLRKFKVLHIFRERNIDSCKIIATDTVRRVTADSIPRLHLCIYHNGGHTEHILRIQAVFILPYGSRPYGTLCQQVS